MEALGDITKLPGASVDELTTAFQRVKKVIAIAEKKGMDEATTLKFVDRLAAERAGGEGAFETISAEMRGWRPPTAEQVAAEATLDSAHKDLLDLQTMQSQLEAELAARRAGKVSPDAERMREIEEDLRRLKGETVPTRTGQYRIPGAVAEARQAFDEAMRLAARARLDPKVLMRSAFAVSAERKAVINAAKGVDQVGGLLKPASGLHPDHIVSLQRMTGMEGFEKLTLLERQRLAVRADNLIAMDAAANLSKGDRLWSAWRQASTFYPADTIVKMSKQETELAATIQEWIRQTVAGRP